MCAVLIILTSFKAVPLRFPKVVIDNKKKKERARRYGVFLGDERLLRKEDFKKPEKCLSQLKICLSAVQKSKSLAARGSSTLNLPAGLFTQPSFTTLSNLITLVPYMITICMAKVWNLAKFVIV